MTGGRVCEAGDEGPRGPARIRAEKKVFFSPRVKLHAELTDADPETYPLADTPYEPKLACLEDVQ
eukprot:4150283-Pyramimonas_sp.AAC.1